MPFLAILGEVLLLLLGKRENRRFAVSRAKTSKAGIVFSTVALTIV